MTDAKPYISSIMSRYGDVERVKTDAKIVNEILGRQGSEFLIDLIAEQCGHAVIKFKLNEADSARMRESLVTDLREAILERT